MKKTFKRKVVNGRNYQLLTLPGTDMFKFEIVNAIGSNIERVIDKLENKNVYGISHFIEHLGFRATRDFSTTELMEMLKVNGSYNASTDHSRINYWFKTNSQRINTAINLVCNYAFNDLTKISPEEFEIEKKVVYNEAKRYADDDQTMFAFNVTPTICGYHVEDNVIGLPETIDTFTIEDAIAIKRIFLDAGFYLGCQTFNITYDNSVFTEDEVIAAVEFELNTWYPSNHKEYQPAYTNVREKHREYTKMLGDVNVGEFTIPNESEQAMTSITLDVIGTDTVAARIGNAYISSYSKSSLNDLIRERNGLTYGVYFYEDTIAYYPYTVFACDVTRGTEKLLMELFAQSINESADLFTEVEYQKVMDTVKLKRTLALIDQQKYDTIHSMAFTSPHVLDKFRLQYEEDMDRAYDVTDNELASYEKVKAYLERVREIVNTKAYSIATN